MYTLRPWPEDIESEVVTGGVREQPAEASNRKRERQAGAEFTIPPKLHRQHVESIDELLEEFPELQESIQELVSTVDYIQLSGGN
jgi:hypothetical protein